MASKESQVAAQVRLNQWAQEIQDCQNRPKDMTVDEWCKQHNIKESELLLAVKVDVNRLYYAIGKAKMGDAT